MTAVDIERLARRFDGIALQPQRAGIPVFRCPVCGSRVRNDATGIEPACTGPSPSRDDHPMTVMERVADEQPLIMIHLRA